VTTLNEVKELIKERADLATHIAKDTKLFKTGQGFKVLSLPGHSEKTLPSISTRARIILVLWLPTRRDIFTYYEQTRAQPFMETLKDLAEEYRIELPRILANNPMAKRVRPCKLREQSLSLMERACKYFEENLHRASSPGAEAAQKIFSVAQLHARNGQTFSFGLAPEMGSRLARKLADLIW